MVLARFDSGQRTIATPWLHTERAVMPKVANHINIHLADEGHVDTAHVTSAPLTSVKAYVGDTSETHEYMHEATAQWTAAALDSAAYHALSEGSIVLPGVTVTDRVTARIAKIQGEALTSELIANSAVAPRPQSAKEVRQDMVDGMREDGKTDADIIAALLG